MGVQDELRPTFLHGFAFRVYLMFSKIRKHTEHLQILTNTNIQMTNKHVVEKSEKTQTSACDKPGTTQTGLGVPIHVKMSFVFMNVQSIIIDMN